MTSMIDGYLQEMVNRDASDLYITHGSAPSLRIDNRIMAMDIAPFESNDISVILDDLLSFEQRAEFESALELNIAYALATGERFRINVFRQRGNVGMVVRHIRAKIPTFEELSLPAQYSDFIMEKRGLFIMVGATGSGKSTSLASMLDYRNAHGNGHIITIEDPIEYYHEHKGSIITQREVGFDTYSYGIALKNALRQSPDVIMIGEIRDRETLENAILFCETGHLVVTTLHASNTHQAIERMVNMFPEEQHRQVLVTLAQNLNVIASQRLIETVAGGKRCLAYEVMINEGLITNLIADGDVRSVREVMEKNRDQGMVTFDQCIFDLLENGLVSEEVALKEADNPNNLKLRINQSRRSADISPVLSPQQHSSENNF